MPPLQGALVRTLVGELPDPGAPKIKGFYKQELIAINYLERECYYNMLICFVNKPKIFFFKMILYLVRVGVVASWDFLYLAKGSR